MARKAVWLSFDLGIGGDYEGLYTWLAHREAKECGDSVAFFQYQSSPDLAAKIKADLERSVQLTKRTRIYLMYLAENNHMKGHWLFGSRRQAPWTGYATIAGEIEDDAI